MATKEVVAVAPLLVLLYDRTFVAGSFRAAWRERRGLHLTLAATWVLLGWLVIGAGARGGTFNLGDPRAWWRYDLTQVVAVVRYLGLAVWPHPLAIDYGTFWVGHAADIAPQAVLVLALLAATGIALVRWPVWGFVGGWFVLILAPSSVVPGTIQMIVEHRMYLPLAALTVLAAAAAHRWWGARTGSAVLAAAALALAGVTAARNRDYASAIGLFEDTVAKRPANARAMALLADYYRRAGRFDQARQWLERSLAVEPGVIPVLNNLGDIWQELGEPAKAAACFRQVLAANPRDAGARNNLGNALVLSGQVPEGIAELEAALRLAPDSASTRRNLAGALAQSGHLAEAEEQFAALVRRNPADAGARADHARVLDDLGRRAEAIAELEAAVAARPADAGLRDRLGVALGRAGRVQEALAQFEEALRLNPADAVARENAARAQRFLGGR